jgi:hypothetical protein
MAPKVRPPEVVWTEAPTPQGDGREWRVLRVPPKGLAGLIVLSDELVGTDTHYFGGRTVPHAQENCQACAAGNQRRWHGYLAVWSPKHNTKWILEITDAAGDTVKKIKQKRPSLRSMSFAGQRVPVKPNGTLIVQLTDSDWAADGLPRAPDLRRMLMRMWGFREEPWEYDLHSAMRGRANALKSNGQAG